MLPREEAPAWPPPADCPVGAALPAEHHRARLVNIRKHIQTMVHATQCKVPTCKFQSCQKLKRMISHIRLCGRGINEGTMCTGCRHLIALCCFHARTCHEVKCLVPHCDLIKRKLKQLQPQA